MRMIRKFLLGATAVAVLAGMTVGTPATTPKAEAATRTTAAAAAAVPDAVARAESWVQANGGRGVPYSNSSYYSNKYGSYRQDCSGYVSMIWNLGSSYSTVTLPNVAHRITKAELTTGDVLIDNTGGSISSRHVVMFDRWVDAAHKSFWLYEQTPKGTRHRTASYSSYDGVNDEYHPYSKNGASTVCPAGYACVWSNTNYRNANGSGTPSGKFYQSLNFRGTVIDNKTSSVTNNGRYSVACFYDKSPWNAANNTSFCLNNPARGGQSRDPNLANGTDTDHRNWDNKISYGRFVS
jgi:hypothetical protein